MQRSLYVSLLLSFLFFSNSTFAQDKSLAERLGYAKTDKLLIIHADDIGLSQSENAASIDAFKIGLVNSGSIMVPCPWFPEIANYAKENPDLDLGLHLTVTSEWKNFKWGGSAEDKASSLETPQGFLYDNCTDFGKNAKLEEVELELRAQIERAIAFGIQPTHLDSHMGCLFFQSPDLFRLYLQLGREYKIPVLLSKEFQAGLPAEVAQYISEEDLIIDRIIGAGEQNYADGLADFYANALRSLQPGITEIIIHVAYDNSEMQAICVDHPGWGATWRQQDFDFFTSERCRKIIEEEGIKLITWREIGKLLR